jgi:hypothetical protein
VIETSVDKKKDKRTFALAWDLKSKEAKSCWVFTYHRGALWVTTSAYVSNQYVHDVGLFKMNRRLSKRLKFVVVVRAISSLECHCVEGFMDALCDSYYDVEMTL